MREITFSTFGHISAVRCSAACLPLTTIHQDKNKRSAICGQWAATYTGRWL